MAVLWPTITPRLFYVHFLIKCQVTKGFPGKTGRQRFPDSNNSSDLEVTLDDIFYPDRVSNSNLLYFERLEKIIEHRDFTIEMLHRTAQESIKELNSIITKINSKEEDKDFHYPLYPKLSSLKGFGYEKYQSVFADEEEEGE